MLRLAGFEATLRWQPVRGQIVTAGWSGLSGAHDALGGLLSEYVYNFPVENVHAGWRAALGRGFTVNNGVNVVKRYQATPYAVWNSTWMREQGRVQPYLRLNNLANTGYEEISGVRMQGRSIVGGVTVQLGR